MKIGEHRTETLIKPGVAANETHLNISSLNTCLGKILQFWKTFSSNPYATGFFTGLLTVFVIATFCYILLRLRKKLTVRYGIHNSRNHNPDINSTKWWNPHEKGPAILKWEYPESCSDTENNSDENKGPNVLDIKGDIKALNTIKCKLPRPKPIKEVILESTEPQESSTSIGSRKLTGDEWRQAFSTDPSKKATTDNSVDEFKGGLLAKQDKFGSD